MGGGSPPRLARLQAMADNLGVADRVRWCGPQTDLPAVLSALDALVLCSRSEGCPNVVMEAMACGTPCVVTRVGAAAEIVGSAGVVVTDHDPATLAAAIESVIQRGCSPDACRSRVLDALTDQACHDCTEAALREVVAGAGDMLSSR